MWCSKAVFLNSRPNFAAALLLKLVCNKEEEAVLDKEQKLLKIFGKNDVQSDNYNMQSHNLYLHAAGLMGGSFEQAQGQTDGMPPRFLGSPRRCNIVPAKVTLSGPMYVQTKRKLSLICTSNIDSVDSAVSFQLNNRFYAKIHKNLSGCFSNLEESSCQNDLCQCFLDGRTFLLQYVTEINDDVLAFKCSMVSKNVGTLSDSLYVSVVGVYIDLKFSHHYANIMKKYQLNIVYNQKLN
ncbi:unnamed protein product [Mytilus coruscus]|uniref:Uncharacterized protein n=1 Tax=Mytilus coruscus TaxID=42192 RepID=A0A6J8DKK9_MYTCO|nr:unnamed protein product [Mytilus coruscus]